ncbi:uncharacterized protein LOC135936298 [Cloeon dipterum]|uniref:uncharacterized protein LOC135936298 n=1 Tax=Cloeon dipterum TaxID=197152 RepID=UPI003220972C
MQGGRIALLLLAASLGASALPVERETEIININGEEYLLSNVPMTRHESMAFCASRNMSLLSFDRPGRYEDLYFWSWETGWSSAIFWTSALREEGQKKWIWETSGEQITDFHWGLQQPELANNYSRQCFFFWPYFGGNFDELCTETNSSSATASFCQHR